MWNLKVGVVSKENNNLECVDCSPSRKFRNLAGLKGHMQFKHDKTGSFIQRPPSKTNAMIQQLLDQQGQLLNQQQALYELLAAGSDDPVAVNEPINEPIGVFSGGNGNDHQGNNLGNVDQVEDVQGYYCENRGFLRMGSLCGADVEFGDEKCGTCGSELDWDKASR
jgi:hypothetical protein